MLSGDETDAIRACQRGDPTGLDLLVARYQVEAVRLAYLLLGESALAEDVAQDSFLLAYRHINSFHAGRAFAPWLFRIVTNTARQRLRSARRRHEVSLDALLEDDANSSLARSAFSADRAGEIDPLARAERREDQTAILAALDTLSQKQREAVILRYYFGYSDRDMAEALGCREGTARQRLHAGLVALERAIRQRYPWLVSANGLRPSSRHASTTQEAARHGRPEYR